MAAKKAAARRYRKNRRATAYHRSFGRVATPMQYLEHPRYGDAPIISGERWTEADVLRSYWGYKHLSWAPKIIYPETARRADCNRQKFCCFARWLYVDIGRQCRTCRRWFLFFALEQKYWYETLGFHTNIDCLDCWECRRDRHHKERLADEYQDLLSRTDKTVGQWNRLSELGDQLFEIGYIKKPGTLQKTRMPKRLRARLLG